jgi:hypothetical protein
MAYDKNKDEPTAEVDSVAYRRWRVAEDAIKQWKIESELAQAELKRQVGDAHAGTIDGKKVIYYRPIATYRQKDLLAENADLASHYFVPGPDVFQMERFAAMHPEIADKYRSRAFKDAS